MIDYNEDRPNLMKVLDGNEIRVLSIITLVLPWLDYGETIMSD